MVYLVESAHLQREYYGGEYYRGQLERKRSIESIPIYPTAVNIDLPIQLFIELFNGKIYMSSTLPIQITELQDFEKKVEKIHAIESVFGLLNDLTADQLETFEKAIKRRPLFK